MAKFSFYKHTIAVDTKTDIVTCETCTVPSVIAHSVRFMFQHSIRVMVVDGTALERVE